MNIGGFGGLEDVEFSRIRVRVFEVIHDGRVEQNRVLGHNADVFPKAVELQVADIPAVDPDGAAVHVVEAVQELEAGRLAASRFSHERGLRPGRDSKTDPVDRRVPLLSLVGEPHIAELDFAFGRLEIICVGLFDHAGGFFKLGAS